MDPETRSYLAQAIGPDALTAAEAFAADLPPAFVARFERLLWTLDQGTTDRGLAEQQRVDTLVRAHLATGAWYDVLRNHCGGDAPGCCAHPEQPEQRMLTEDTP